MTLPAGGLLSFFCCYCCIRKKGGKKERSHRYRDNNITNQKKKKKETNREIRLSFLLYIGVLERSQLPLLKDKKGYCSKPYCLLL